MGDALENVKDQCTKMHHLLTHGMKRNNYSQLGYNSHYFELQYNHLNVHYHLAPKNDKTKYTKALVWMSELCHYSSIITHQVLYLSTPNRSNNTSWSGSFEPLIHLV